MKFNLICGTSTPAGLYYITWTKEEEGSKDEYAEILSTTLRVNKATTSGSVTFGTKPTIDLTDFYYVNSGTKTVVLVSISQKPSDYVVLVVSCNATDDSSVYIDNSIIRFDNEHDSGNFTITPTSTS